MTTPNVKGTHLLALAIIALVVIVSIIFVMTYTGSCTFEHSKSGSTEYAP